MQYESEPEATETWNSLNAEVMKEVLAPHEIRSVAVNYEDTIEFTRIDYSQCQTEVNEKVKKWEKN